MHTHTDKLMQAETAQMVLNGETVRGGILNNWPLPAALITDQNGNVWIALDSKVIRQVRAQSSSYAR